MSRSGTLRREAIWGFATVLGMLALNPLQLEAQPAPRIGGLRLQSASAFVTYYSTVPEDLMALTATPQIGERRVGVSATVRYSRLATTSALSIDYSPSYATSIGNRRWNASNHYLVVKWRSDLNGRWDYDIYVSAGASSTNEVLFAPTTLASAVAAPTSFGDPAGNLNSSQLASILTGGSVLDSPAALLIYGNRMFTSEVRAGISYSYSSRLTIRFGGAFAREQFLKGGAENSGYLLPRTSRGAASVEASYSLSPRTQLGVGGSTTRVISMLQDAYWNSASLSLGRAMGKRWFAQTRGGVGFVTAVRQSYEFRGSTQYQAEGGIGYKAYAHTFMASAKRVGGDAYGFAADSTTSATGAWNWQPPGSAWSASSSFGQERLAGGGFPTFTSWRAAAGIGRRLSRSFVTFAEYVYIDYSGLTGRVGKRINQHAARVAVNWEPNGGAAR